MRTALFVTIALALALGILPDVTAGPPTPGPVCSAVLGVCIEPSDPAAVDWERIRDLLGPCTCDPID